MSTKSDLDRLKAAYKAWHDTKGGSTAAWMDLFADSVAIRSTGAPVQAMAFAADRKSKQGAVEYFSKLLDTWSMLHWSPATFVAEGNRIAMFGTCGWTNKATGKSAEVRIAHLWHFENGKVTDIEEIFDTAAALAAATA